MCRTTRNWRGAIGADLVIASDGLNSRIRTRYALTTYQPAGGGCVSCRFVWLGTNKKLFDAFTFAFQGN